MVSIKYTPECELCVCACVCLFCCSVGLLNASAFFSRIRTACPSQYIIDILYADMEVITLEAFLRDKPPHTSMVLVNGIIAGFTDNPLNLVSTYRRYRSWYSVPIDSSVSYQSNTDQVCINADGEDAFRPLFCLENLHKLQAVYQIYRNMPSALWTRLLIEGVIEYVNKEEEAELYIVVTYDEYLQNLRQPEPQLFTHMEIHASFTIHGVAAGAIPFSNHNQAPRYVGVENVVFLSFVFVFVCLFICFLRQMQEYLPKRHGEAGDFFPALGFFGAAREQKLFPSLPAAPTGHDLDCGSHRLFGRTDGSSSGGGDSVHHRIQPRRLGPDEPGCAAAGVVSDCCASDLQGFRGQARCRSGKI